MRYGIISDIHGNLPALEKVLGELEGLNIGKYLCLGDVVGYNPWPNECCALVRELDCATVRGNHDEAVVDDGCADDFNVHARETLLWTRENLSAENREYLGDLPHSLVVDELTLCHGSLPEPFAYVASPLEAMPTFMAMRTQICFIGHTHYAEWYELQEGEQRCVQHLATAGAEFGIEDERRYVINQGSVGQPRDGDTRASFGVYDDEERRMEIRRVIYDIGRVQREMLRVGLPEAMAVRLSYGV